MKREWPVVRRSVCLRAVATLPTSRGFGLRRSQRLPNSPHTYANRQNTHTQRKKWIGEGGAGGEGRPTAVWDNAVESDVMLCIICALLIVIAIFHLAPATI